MTMPQVSTIVSGVASITLLAGVVSGIFYLVLTGIRWAGRVRAALQEEEHRKTSSRCISCGRTFNASATPPIVCAVCGHRACFDLPCSRPAPIGWNCIVCHTKRTTEAASKDTDENISGVKRRRSSANSNNAEGIDAAATQVREFIEKLVENIIGGSMDGVPVGKLSHHSAYQELFANYHEPMCQTLASLGGSLRLMGNSKFESTPEVASSAHTALSHLIEKIAEEAARLPNLAEPIHQDHKNNAPSPIHDKSYEDILSTAILNKIIRKYQNKNGYGTPERRDSNSNVVNRLVNGMRRQNVEEDVEDSEEWSDYSTHDPLAIKVEERIEEVTTAYESSSDDLDEIEEHLGSSRRVPFPEYGVDLVDGTEEEDDNPSDNESISTDKHSNPSTWEDNWLFQKKKLKKHHGHNPVPVPMLVPNPSQDFRALIGGIDADDVSDLSECSDSVLEEAMYEAEEECSGRDIVDALNGEEEHSRSEESTKETYATVDGLSSTETQIGSLMTDDTAKGETTDVDEDSGIQPLAGSEDDDDDVIPPIPTAYHHQQPLAGSEDDDDDVIPPTSTAYHHQQPLAGSEDDDDDVIPPLPTTPLPSLGEQDRDVPVEFDTALQITRPPVPKPRTLELNLSEELADKPFVGPISEREKAKWNNAVEMKNNPYTPENIAKRSLSKSLVHLNGIGSRESIDFPTELPIEEKTRDRKYSRDYYVKSARSPTGEQPSRVNDSPVSFRSEASIEDDTCVQAVRVQVCEELPTQLEKNETQTKEINKLENFLPNVGELKKNFLAKKPPIPTRSKSVPRKQSRELVSQMVKNISEQSEPENSTSTQDRIFNEVEEIRRTSLKKPEKARSSSQSETDEAREEFTEIKWLNKTRKPVKPVHSLTARSLSKDFREGLKIKSKHGPSVSTAERIPEIYSDDNSLQKLNFDVRGKKNFWENIAKMKN